MRSLWKTARGRRTAAVATTTPPSSRLVRFRDRPTTRWASLLDQQVNGLHAKRPSGDVTDRRVTVTPAPRCRVADVLNDEVVGRSVLRDVGHFPLYIFPRSYPPDNSPPISANIKHSACCHFVTVSCEQRETKKTRTILILLLPILPQSHVAVH